MRNKNKWIQQKESRLVQNLVPVAVMRGRHPSLQKSVLLKCPPQRSTNRSEAFVLAEQE